MKRIATISLLFSTTLFGLTPVSGQSAVEEAIKKVCNAETQGWLDNDVETWIMHHAKTEGEVLAGIGDDGVYFEINGWSKIEPAVREWAKNGTPQKTKHETRNHRFTIQGDMAFVDYDQTLTAEDGKVSRSREFRVLLQSRGQWKILSVLFYYQKPEEKK